MGERLVRNEEVRGSIPLSSTTLLFNPLLLLGFLVGSVNFFRKVFTPILFRPFLGYSGFVLPSVFHVGHVYLRGILIRWDFLKSKMIKKYL